MERAYFTLRNDYPRIKLFPQRRPGTFPGRDAAPKAIVNPAKPTQGASAQRYATYAACSG